MYLIFYCVAVALAVVFGPQTTPWTWGPGLVATGLAVVALGGKRRAGKCAWSWLYLPGWLCIGWFVCRALWSPVREYGISDAVLAASVFGAFWVGLRFRQEGGLRDNRVLAGFLVLVIVANAVVVAVQLRDPGYTPVFGSRRPGSPSGFLGHYNEFSNVMLAFGFALLSFACWGRMRWWTRVVLFAIFLASMICIYLSGSRGGLMGVGTGALVFAIVALLEAKRRNSRWFAPGVILLPLVLLAAGWFVGSGLGNSQASRKAAATADALLNDGRLYALGLAARCSMDHLWQGGGSHSFAWESRQYWSTKDTAWNNADLVYVHNEFAQAVTDYGLAGGILLGLAMACLFGNALWELVQERRAGDGMTSDIWLAGAVSGAAAILAQSNFAFVFHNQASCLLLGFFLGLMAARARVVVPDCMTDGRRGWLRMAGYGALGGVLLVAGVQGSRALAVMWPAEYMDHSKHGVSPVVAAGQLERAAGYWPHSELYASRVVWLLRAAETTDEAVHICFLEEAEAACRKARGLDPLNPVGVVNHANVLSYLGRNREALAAYDDAIRLQGGYECGVRAHYHKGLHLRKMALAELSRQRIHEGLARMLEANNEFRKVREQSDWYFSKAFPEEQLYLLEATARLQTQLGLPDDAEHTLAEAAALPESERANYLYAVRLYDKAVALWHGRQPGKALAVFLHANGKLVVSRGVMPPGVTPGEHQKFVQNLQDSIRFLQGARVEPEE